MSLENYLTDDERVYRRTAGAKNDYGDASDTWSLVGTIKGTIQPKSGNTARVESGILESSTHRLYCLVTANIHNGDKVLDKNDKWYDVLFVADASNRSHHYQVDLRELE
jgi:hypothetical protein